MPARSSATTKQRVRDAADGGRASGRRPARPPGEPSPAIVNAASQPGSPTVYAIWSRRAGAQAAPVRLGMSLAEARDVASMIVDTRGSSFNRALRDLLWLQVVLIEQWRRTARPERNQFERRADAILATFWAGATAGVPSGAGHTVGHHDKP